MNQFQGRLQRCSMDCQDRARDKYPTISANSSEKDKEKFEVEMLNCATACVDKHISLLRSVSARLEGEIDRITSSTK